MVTHWRAPLYTYILKIDEFLHILKKLIWENKHFLKPYIRPLKFLQKNSMDFGNLFGTPVPARAPPKKYKK